jgi:uncharacterized protein YjbJ (UPF0337 family)
MNKEQVTGKLDQVAGKVKQKVGEAVGNDQMANSGVADQVKGAAKETWGNAKDAAHDHKEVVRSEHESHAADARDKVVEKVQDVKRAVNEKIDEHRRPA